MAAVSLRPDGSTRPPDADPLARIPRRFRLGRAGVDRLLELTGTPAPWVTAEPGHVDRLGPASPPPAGPAASDPAASDPDAALTAAGLLTPLGDVAPEAGAALAVFGAPEALVDVDVSVRRPDAPAGFVQARSWQRFAAGRVTTLATAGGGVLELGWFDDDLWQAELARTATVSAPETALPSPARVLDLPHEFLLGTGAALRQRREDVFAELARRYTGTVRRDGGAALDLTGTAEQARLLHLSVCGRLQAVVSGVGTTGARKAGWVSWLLFPDGWRALTPHTDRGVPRVRVHPVGPGRLGVEVARLVTGVRG